MQRPSSTILEFIQDVDGGFYGLCNVDGGPFFLSSTTVVDGLLMVGRQNKPHQFLKGHNLCFSATSTKNGIVDLISGLLSTKSCSQCT